MNLEWKKISKEVYTKFIVGIENLSVAYDPEIQQIFAQVLNKDLNYFGFFANQKLSAVLPVFTKNKRHIQPYLIERQGIVFEKFANDTEKSITLNLYLKFSKSHFKSVRIPIPNNVNIWEKVRTFIHNKFVYKLPIDFNDSQVKKNLRQIAKLEDVESNGSVFLNEQHISMLKETSIKNKFFNELRFNQKVEILKMLDLKGYLKTFEVKHNQELMSVACFIVSNLTQKMEVIQFLSGQTKSKLNLNTLLFFEAYNYLAIIGLKRIDGGGASTEGLINFKKSMGAIEVQTQEIIYHSNPFYRYYHYLKSKF